MLVLSRRESERVQILNLNTGDELFVTLADIRGDKVRIGFEGPPHYRFMREELLEQSKPPANSQSSTASTTHTPAEPDGKSLP